MTIVSLIIGYILDILAYHTVPLRSSLHSRRFLFRSIYQIQPVAKMFNFAPARMIDAIATSTLPVLSVHYVRINPFNAYCLGYRFMSFIDHTLLVTAGQLLAGLERD